MFSDRTNFGWKICSVKNRRARTRCGSKHGNTKSALLTLRISPRLYLDRRSRRAGSIPNILSNGIAQMKCATSGNRTRSSWNRRLISAVKHTGVHDSGATSIRERRNERASRGIPREGIPTRAWTEPTPAVMIADVEEVETKKDRCRRGEVEQRFCSPTWASTRAHTHTHTHTHRLARV